MLLGCEEVLMLGYRDLAQEQVHEHEHESKSLKSEEHKNARCASMMDDKIVYTWSKRIVRMKEAESFSVDLFEIDVISNGDSEMFVVLGSVMEGEMSVS